MTELSLRAADLRTGDVLTATGTRIERDPERGVRTPTGCVDVLIRYPRSGVPSRVQWRANTTMRVRRP